jgi:arylformamidase
MWVARDFIKPACAVATVPAKTVYGNRPARATPVLLDNRQLHRCVEADEPESPEQMREASDLSARTGEEVIDITMNIEQGMPVYPGNPAPEIEEYRSLPEDSTAESEICLGSHTGTHVDAPSHLDRDGKTAEGIRLNEMMGAAEVLDLTDADDHIEASDLPSDLDESIVVLKTENSQRGYEEFREDFTGLKLSAVKELVSSGVETVAVDYLSLTPYDGTEEDHETHRLGVTEMNVVEGVRLTGVEPGSYRFVALPLKMSTDATPVRAVLIPYR